MAKLSSVKRQYAIKDIREGKLSNKEIQIKYEISASAICYLKKMSTGSTPKLVAFEESLGFYCPERILRLAKEGVEPKDLASDYETTTSVMKAYLNKVWPLPAKSPKINMKKLQSSLGRNKKTTSKRK
jgi:hypothetical protein